MGRNGKFRRGIYLLPTLFTIGNLFCGFYAVVSASRGEFERAALMVIVAGVLDGLDGRIARMTRSTSAFGTQFDSLADLVSFGIAPAMLAYHWALAPLGRIGWLVPFLYLVCAAMRLARFNIKVASSDKRFFAGLPSPGSAGALASLVFAFPAPPGGTGLVVAVAVLVGTLGLLMLSTFRYRSFKDLDLAHRRSYLVILPLAAMLVAVAIQPKGALLLFASVYLMSAPLGYLWGLLSAQPRRTRVEEVADGRVAR
ncbi:MAG TPA: CDP-diacylglycerol--serine O-phosphatidyltransferase [Candidatus Polarisedimenticolaceae bacterium]|nr:CDP-diacylglycerol--serine O-phosphatidyltransferase [Candidatus Polarisedimenticolaceae bacterium]